MQIKDEIYDKDDELPSVMTVDELQNYTNDITRNYTKSNEQIVSNYYYLYYLKQHHQFQGYFIMQHAYNNTHHRISDNQ